ncbi:hypothetical protein BpHYR1_009834 [Brachionus plicatilis]|uniref:Uncharacterized protein n=1 Tax=Brachionus plicatilis TaxID=10195 RepID=A0A3M7P9T6_BRAPC|nr:hypothetical protein BpHYR1_009834 [Brachionus plicatilis]
MRKPLSKKVWHIDSIVSEIVRRYGFGLELRCLEFLASPCAERMCVERSITWHVYNISSSTENGIIIYTHEFVSRTRAYN